MNLECLGLLQPGRSSEVADGVLRAPTAGSRSTPTAGGLCNNQPRLPRGGMIRMLEAVRQLRGTAAPEVQLADPEFAIVHGSSYSLGTPASAATAILQRGDAA